MSRFQLRQDDQGSCLVDTYSNQRPLRINFLEARFVQRLKKAGRKNELVARAIKASDGVRVLDCTAGLGKEACLLAHLGCEVTLVERSVVVAELIRSGIAHAAREPDLADCVGRMHLRVMDSRQFLRDSTETFDAIYIDPMFPGRSGSAAVSGEMQMLQRYLGTDEDALGLLELAMQSGAGRVVVKRPPGDDWHPPVAPLHVFAGKNSCYEVFGA